MSPGDPTSTNRHHSARASVTSTATVRRNRSVSPVFRSPGDGVLNSDVLNSVWKTALDRVTSAAQYKWRIFVPRETKTLGSIEISLESGNCVVRDEQDQIVDQEQVDIEDLRNTYEARLRERAWHCRPPNGVKLLLTWQSGRCEFLNADGHVVGEIVVEREELWHDYERQVIARVRAAPIWGRFSTVGRM